MQYLYSDGDLYYFMDNESYEQMPINGSVLGDNFKFVKENMDCKVLSYKGNVFGVEPPNFVELEVTKTEPGVQRRHRYQHLEARHPGDLARKSACPCSSTRAR